MLKEFIQPFHEMMQRPKMQKTACSLWGETVYN